MHGDDKYGLLTLLAFYKVGTRKYVLCKCECGNAIKMRLDAVKAGATKSCGCLHRKAAAKIGKANTRHGDARRGVKSTPEYTAWCAMRQRCSNPHNGKYPLYGGRGIKVCERWLFYPNFHLDMGPRPSALYSLDRINVDGNYEPSNCRWATQKVQQNNRRNTGAYRRAA